MKSRTSILIVLALLAVSLLSGCQRTSYPAVWVSEPTDKPPYTVQPELNGRSDSKTY